ncbi:MAG: hypothetical protein PVG32_21345 [Anaerolineales bacterium]
MTRLVLNLEGEMPAGGVVAQVLDRGRQQQLLLGAFRTGEQGYRINPLALG